MSATREFTISGADGSLELDRGFAGTPNHVSVLVIANRSTATPDLVAAVRRYANQRPTAFALLIPDAPRAEHPDWTLERALAIFERAARGPVTGLTGTHRDPFAAVRDAVATNRYDRIIISTLPNRASKWLRRDLPRRLESLGVPIEVIGPEREKLSDFTGAPMMSGCELWLKTGAFTKDSGPRQLTNIPSSGGNAIIGDGCARR